MFLDDTVKIHGHHQADILRVGGGLHPSYHPVDHRPESPPQPASYSMNVTYAWNCLYVFLTNQHIEKVSLKKGYYWFIEPILKRRYL